MTNITESNTLVFDKNIGKKYIATLIDYAIVFGVTYALVRNLGEPNDKGGYTLNGWPALLPCLFWFIYLPIIEGIFQSTLGHYLVGLKVIQRTGENANPLDCIKRRLLDPIDFFFFGIPAVIAIKNSPAAQRLGDQFAKTIVVEKSFPRQRLEIN